MPDFDILNLKDTLSPPKNTKTVGQTGENLAARFLARRGLRLVCSNFKVPIGRNRRGAAVTGEIDLVALDGRTLCFIEVKTRSSDEFAAPLSAVDLRKQRQIIRTARVYRKIFNLSGIKYRYDAVGIVLGEAGRTKIEYFENFWQEEKFRKKVWNDELY
ncbi:MAG: YraN family protein [Acidobacteria bacterium]|nr:YraN family protein [Acidobacteriota bacterium]